MIKEGRETNKISMLVALGQHTLGQHTLGQHTLGQHTLFNIKGYLFGASLARGGSPHYNQYND